MDPIVKGMQGPAVEDVQSRLVRLGFAIDSTEVDGKTFGDSTAQAVKAFRADNDLMPGDEVDTACWSALVDASYRLGDRTLYLRLPNFHGADVRALQQALNVLGFACGTDDGYFGPHTEAALQQFQENYHRTQELTQRTTSRRTGRGKAGVSSDYRFKVPVRKSTHLFP